MIRRLPLSGLLLFLSWQALASEPYFQSESIFPPEAWHNHSSSVVECRDGALLVAWFHGSGERTADDVVIRGARKAPGAKTWSPPFVLADTPGYPDCNPTLFIDPAGKLWLFWANVLSNQWQSALLKYRTSTQYDDPDRDVVWNWQGVIHLTPDANFAADLMGPWDEFKGKHPEFIPDLRKELKDLKADEEIFYYIEKMAKDKLQQRLGWMPRIHPLLLRSGRILLPLYTDAYSVSLVAYTDDNGETWNTSRPLVGYGNIQPSLVEKTGGTVAAFMRENGFTGRIRYCESTDGGVNWGPVTETDIPNPGSSVECIRLANGHWVLVCNDTADGRHQLRLSVSDDEGKTWKASRYVEKSEPGQGSYSYPSLLQARGGRLHLTYSRHVESEGKTIQHAEFDEEWILAGEE